MSLDIIEYALDNLTDWALFEKLACEILRFEGFPDIKPLGGSKDLGLDAEVTRHYHHVKREKIVAEMFIKV